MDKILLNDDALGVIKRIKKINKNYEVYYNLNNKKYMLYLFENDLKPSSYCLTFNYSSLDERMIEQVLKSEIQNRKYVLNEIEKSNALLLKQEQKNIMNQMENLSDGKRNN